MLLSILFTAIVPGSRFPVPCRAHNAINGRLRRSNSCRALLHRTMLLGRWCPLTAPYRGCPCGHCPLWWWCPCGVGWLPAGWLPAPGSRCGVVGHCLQWVRVDSGYSPTIGVPLWWGAPYSGDRWIVGASPLLGLPDCGCARIVGAYLLLKL